MLDTLSHHHPTSAHKLDPTSKAEAETVNQQKAERQFENVVIIHPISYTYNSRLPGKSTAKAPSHSWTVSIDPVNKDITFHGSTEHSDAIESTVYNSPEKASADFKHYSGKPCGKVEIARALLYLWATRKCDEILVKNIGCNSQPEYDLGNAKCLGEKRDHEEIFEKLGRATEPVLWEATSAKAMRITVRGTDRGL